MGKSEKQLRPNMRLVCLVWRHFGHMVDLSGWNLVYVPGKSSAEKVVKKKEGTEEITAGRVEGGTHGY